MARNSSFSRLVRSAASRRSRSAACSRSASAAPRIAARTAAISGTDEVAAAGIGSPAASCAAAFDSSAMGRATRRASRIDTPRALTKITPPPTHSSHQNRRAPTAAVGVATTTMKSAVGTRPAAA